MTGRCDGGCGSTGPIGRRCLDCDFGAYRASDAQQARAVLQKPEWIKDAYDAALRYGMPVMPLETFAVMVEQMALEEDRV